MAAYSAKAAELLETGHPASKRSLARVLLLHPGSDGLSKVVTLQIATTIPKRPITRLVVLPVPGLSDVVYITNDIYEYRTKFYITRCENADFRTRSVRKTAFTHTE